MMTFLNEAGSCLALILRFGLILCGAYVIGVTGWERILDDPLYALVVIIFYYQVFTIIPSSKKSEDET